MTRHSTKTLCLTGIAASQVLGACKASADGKNKTYQDMEESACLSVCGAKLFLFLCRLIPTVHAAIGGLVSELG